MNIKHDNNATANKTTSSIKKNALKHVLWMQRNQQFKTKNRIVDGYNKQGHSSVYE
jgi:hypothetical protein